MMIHSQFPRRVESVLGGSSWPVAAKIRQEIRLRLTWIDMDCIEPEEVWIQDFKELATRGSELEQSLPKYARALAAKELKESL